MRYTDEGETLELCRWTVDLGTLPSFQQHANNPQPGGFYTGKSTYDHNIFAYFQEMTFGVRVIQILSLALNLIALKCVEYSSTMDTSVAVLLSTSSFEMTIATLL